MFLMREDDKLILRGVAADFQRLQGWVGVVFVLLGLWATGGSWYASQLAFLVLSVPLIVFGGFLLSRHRTVTTIFDLPSRRVIFTITTSVGWGWYQRSYTYSYSFDEIAGIGVTGGLWGEDGVTVLYSPVMKLRDGQNCWLPNGGSASNRRSRRLAYLQYAEPLAAICAATGLQKLDLEGNFTDRFLAEPPRYLRAARRRFRPPFFSTAKLHRVMELRAALAFYRR